MSKKVVRSGVVKWFDAVKGYGFINPIDDPATDIFVHYSALPGKRGDKNLQEGDVVTFIQDERDNGYYAKEVKTIVRSN